MPGTPGTPGNDVRTVCTSSYPPRILLCTRATVQGFEHNDSVFQGAPGRDGKPGLPGPPGDPVRQQNVPDLCIFNAPRSQIAYRATFAVQTN